MARGLLKKAAPDHRALLWWLEVSVLHAERCAERNAVGTEIQCASDFIACHWRGGEDQFDATRPLRGIERAIEDEIEIGGVAGHGVQATGVGRGSLHISHIKAAGRTETKHEKPDFGGIGSVNRGLQFAGVIGVSIGENETDFVRATLFAHEINQFSG